MPPVEALAWLQVAVLLVAEPLRALRQVPVLPVAVQPQAAVRALPPVAVRVLLVSVRVPRQKHSF